MITEIHYPETLAPEKLDEYLARGWFRMGAMIFTCHYLCFHNELYSAVWARLPLENYRFRKSLRKIINRNRERFRTITRPAIYDDDKERRYQLHKQRFEGYIAPTLRESLFGSSDKFDLYNTWETSIYDGDQLIGASFFDLGADSLASIMGLYDPSYERFSLGFFTMLIEIEHGLQKNMHYYYPGYVVPGYGRFDYKLRIGSVEYFDVRSKGWYPYEKIVTDDLPSEKLRYQLTLLEDELEHRQLPHDRLVYQLYDKKLFGFEDMRYYRAPLILRCGVSHDQRKWLVVDFDFIEDHYRVCLVSRFEEPLAFIYDLFEDVDSDRCILEFLFLKAILLEHEDPIEVAHFIEVAGRDLR